MYQGLVKKSCNLRVCNTDAEILRTGRGMGLEFGGQRVGRVHNHCTVSSLELESGGKKWQIHIKLLHTYYPNYNNFLIQTNKNINRAFWGLLLTNKQGIPIVTLYSYLSLTRCWVIRSVISFFFYLQILTQGNCDCHA